MDVALKDCTCRGPCACAVPAEFVRLRYYFGQRLGVVDLSDEQRYHAGKQRFHNLRAHGSGVLCGLRADRFVFPQGAPAATPTTVLRVTRGAALDGCGRELVVPGDQCIDVEAWYLKNRARVAAAALPTPAPAAPPAGAAVRPPAGAQPAPGAPAAAPTALRLWVALRYRECPSDPGPAPRDPCGCDDGGCEYGRVREGFELALLTDQERECVHDTFPPRADLDSLLDGGGQLGRAVNLLLAKGCPDQAPDCWLCLASVSVTFGPAADGTPIVIDIGPPDNAIVERESLLTTAALQELLGRVLAASGGDALFTGPQLGELNWQNAAQSTGTLVIPVTLVTDPAGGSIQLDDGTFNKAMVDVEQYQANAWTAVPPKSVTYVASAGDVPAHFELTWSGAKTITAGNFRVTLDQPLATPVVDKQMRVLQPLRYARHFHLQTVNNVLTLVDALV